jgi:membrane protein implicated in regulation of membrane protease activity
VLGAASRGFAAGGASATFVALTVVVVFVVFVAFVAILIIASWFQGREASAEGKRRRVCLALVDWDHHPPDVEEPSGSRPFGQPFS